MDRAVIQRGGLTTTIVAVPDRDTAVQVAAELVDAGAQYIELCGAFGPTMTARVIQAVGDQVPVGSVTTGWSPSPPWRRSSPQRPRSN